MDSGIMVLRAYPYPVYGINPKQDPITEVHQILTVSVTGLAHPFSADQMESILLQCAGVYPFSITNALANILGKQRYIYKHTHVTTWGLRLIWQSNLTLDPEP